MGFANVRSENIVRSNNHRKNYKIEKLHSYMAYYCIIATTTKWDHVQGCHSFLKKFFLGYLGEFRSFFDENLGDFIG